MGKEAKNIYPIHDILRYRWSARSFTGQPVEIEKLQSVLEAARWSPSMSNEQPWNFMVGIKGDETWQKIYDLLDPGNQVWCIRAPVLMISFGRSFLKRKPERAYSHYIYDTGQSVAHMSFQAVSLGLIIHQMAGFDRQKAAEVFGAPEGYTAWTAISLGYLGPPDLLKDPHRQWEVDERERKPFKEFVFQEKFGNPAGFMDNA